MSPNVLSPAVPDPVASLDAGPAGARFVVSAAVSPGVLPRVLELFAKRGLTPTECRARAEGARLSIDIYMASMEPRLAGYIGACMRQVHLVDRVMIAAPDDA